MSKARVTGRVCAEDGRPLADAAVMIASGPTHADIASLTDDDGRYVLDALEAGAYSIRVTATDFETAIRQVQLGRGETIADFKLRRQAVKKRN